MVAIIFLMAAAGRSRASDQYVHTGPIDLDIYSGGGERLVGHGHYEVHLRNDIYMVRGENRYANGQWDLETARLKPDPKLGLPPRQLNFSHAFFNPDGTVQLSTSVDFESGQASCVKNLASGPDARNATLDFPPDTYAGASLLIPIRHELSQGRGTFMLHVYNCVPGPKILTIKARVAEKADHLPVPQLGLIEVEIKPDFGWLNLLAAPFVDKLYAWFDPGQGWSYAGAAITRFYHGPRILMISDKKEQSTSHDAALDSSLSGHKFR